MLNTSGHYEPRKRILVCFASLGILVLLIIARLIFLQFIDSKKLILRSDQQSLYIEKLSPYRGKIVDRNGNELGIDVRRKSLGVNPSLIENKPLIAEVVAKTLGINKSFVLERMSRKKEFVWVERMLTDEQSTRLEAMGIKGLEFRPEWKRVYPNGNAASHVLGFTGIDNIGLEGVEYLYDNHLKGIAGWKRSRKDARQRELVSRQEDLVLPVDGYDVKLTLDLQIQHLAEKYLTEACLKYHALGGSVVVMDPENGDVLAIANYPKFDPNSPGELDVSFRRNRAITDIYEPGSVFKVFAISGVLDAGVAKVTDRVFCENGSYQVGGRILHDVHPYGILSVSEVLVNSSNIGTSKLTDKLGKKKLHEQIKAFGFGEHTGIDLPGEIRGIFRDTNIWSATSISSIGMGHEIGVTSIQMAQAMSAIVNGGLLLKPRILMEISNKEKIIKKYLPEMKRRSISEETAKQMVEIMKKVVDSGTGKNAAVKGYVVGGKTGTAQKLEPNGGYSHDHFISSFGGYITLSESEKYVIMVSVDDPKPVYYGGTVAAPIFQKIAQNLADTRGAHS